MPTTDANGRVAGQTVECVVIGTIRTPYKTPADCPKTVHDNPAPCTLVLDPAYAEGLLGLERESHVLVLYWLDRARRDWLRRPARANREEIGVFALRSPMRPNPIAASVVPLVAIRDNEVDVVGLDCIDGTPLLDIKRAIFFEAGEGKKAV